MRLGIVDLDTSHPHNWIPLLRDLGHEVAGLWDGGSVHPAQYAANFARTHHVPRCYDSLKQMAADVDAAIIHGCDWDTHVPKAMPFVEAGKGVLLDKPLAGNVRDLAQLKRWADSGARITGGSSLRFTKEVREFLRRPESERGRPNLVFAGCGVDEFNYGIHAYSLLWSILGPGAESVRWLSDRPQCQVEVTWPDGRKGIVTMGGSGQWQPFYATVVTAREVHHLRPMSTPDPLYKSLLEACLPYLSGDTDEPPLPMEHLMEPELAAIGALESRRRGGEPVAFADLPTIALGFNGAAFAETYRRAKYPEPEKAKIHREDEDHAFR